MPKKKTDKPLAKSNNSRQVRYIKANCETLSMTLPKGTKAKWSAYTKTKGIPLATFIRRYMEECMVADNFEYLPAVPDDIPVV